MKRVYQLANSKTYDILCYVCTDNEYKALEYGKSLVKRTQQKYVFINRAFHPYDINIIGKKVIEV